MLDLLLYRTGIGAKIRAVSDDVAAANLIGLVFGTHLFGRHGHYFRHNRRRRRLRVDLDQLDPASGPTRLLIAFEVIVLGGLGSLGSWLRRRHRARPSRRRSAAQFDIAWQRPWPAIVFLIVLALRPQGLFARNTDPWRNLSLLLLFARGVCGRTA